jgi:hypothetical protein
VADNVHLSGMSSDGKLVSVDTTKMIVGSTFQKKDTVLIPMESHEIKTQSTSSHITRIAVLSTDISSGEGTIVGDVEIPFEKFYDGAYHGDESSSERRKRPSMSQMTPSTDPLSSPSPRGGSESPRSPIDRSNIYSLQHLCRSMPIDRQVIVDCCLKSTEPKFYSYQIRIVSAASLPCSKRTLPPSCYCTVYFVDEHGEKLSTSSNFEGKTDVVAQNNDPVWNKVCSYAMKS